MSDRTLEVRLAYTVMSPEVEIRQPLAYPAPFGEALRRLAAIGYDGVELQVGSPRDFPVQQVADLLREHGLAISALATGPMGAQGASLCDPDPERRQQVVADLQVLVDHAATLGTRVSFGRIMDGAANPGRSREERLATTAGSLRELADYAASREVGLLVEPQCSESTDLVNTVDTALELIAGVGRPHIDVIADTFHLDLTHGSAEQGIRASGDRLGHVQFGDNPGRGRPGTGALPFEKIIGALADLGYQGWITLEHAQDAGERTAELSFDYVNRLTSATHTKEPQHVR
ncbi:hypothetical protein DLE60_27735 [Micromonospora globispora]|uniref:sugar phosphate isomerase/epimerase family protein n=1 Tax=Micromonospora globispora TaxID=1450148 RepID=UPI000D6EE15A|nr:sugar phosphate isomerase/epimerase family protein [Micromonospora globispora]PWU55401.1 hypothetical protein DLE60_27735 [Micromonospora globispora]RQW91800.1 hypothetical protein DKL51_20105 [Micromonospora globispora]